MSDQLKVSGWAIAQAGDADPVVDIEVAGRGTFRAYYGKHRLAVARWLDAPVACGWLRVVTTSEWEPGVYDLVITARDGLGHETSLTRRVLVDARAAYQRWLDQRPLRLSAAYDARRFAEAHPDAPRPLVLVLTDSTAADGLEQTLDSIAQQDYPPFDVVVAGHDQSVRDLDAGLHAFLEGEAEYAVLLRAGDVLQSHALFALASEAVRLPRPAVVYSDHDVMEENGSRTTPFFKPGWSPELLLSMDYVGAFACVSKDAVRRALDIDRKPLLSTYELMLRLVDEHLEVARVPDVLWSRAPGSESALDETRASGLVLGVAERRGRQAEVEPLPYAGTRMVKWSISGVPRVAIVIATAFTDDRVFRCLESIRERTTYPNYEVVIVANGLDRRDVPEILLGDVTHRVVEYDGEFNYSAVNNAGARGVECDYVLFLNDDTEVVTPDWMERMVAEAQQPGVGIVGARLLFPDGIVQVGGQVVLDNIYGAAVTSTGVSADDPGYRGLLAVVRNMTSVCGACMLIERELFEALGGFDEALEIELNDVDLCLRGLEAGRRVVFTPHASLFHHERASRGPQAHDREHDRDHGRFKHRWSTLIRSGDPYYNPNLGYDPDFELALPPDPTPAPGEQHVWSERYVPETMSGLTQAEHEARYLWAARGVAGKEVLDAGCGFGYGTRILARTAARVVGVDISPEAIEDARFRVGSEAELVVGDLQELPFPAASFDVVVCFEAIEHVADREGALDELKRVLRADGTLIISSPNRGIYPAGNPHHVHEYTADELRATLLARFRHVELQRQHHWMATSITDASGLENDDAGTELGGTVHKVTRVAPGREVYTLAIAGDETLPELPPVAVLTDLDELRYWQNRARELEIKAESLERNATLASQHAGLERELTESLERNATLAAQHADLERELDGVLASRSWRLTAALRAAHRRLHRGGS